MYKYIDSIKQTVKVVFVKFGRIVARIIKASCKILFGVIRFTASMIFFVVPFLNTKIDLLRAQYIWYPAFILLFITWILGLRKEDDIDKEMPLFNMIKRWGISGALFVFLSVFVFRYYEIQYIWHWIICMVSAIYFITFCVYIFTTEIKRNTNEEERTILIKNMFANIWLFVFYDLTYVGIFNNWFWATIIFGTIAVAFVFYNLSITFLNDMRSLRFMLVINLLSALLASTYLIYIIPNDSFREIILTICAAVYGGIFTLVGVAWTIKKENAVRIDDMQRIENNRKEEERKKSIPYMKLVHGADKYCEVSAGIHRGLNFSKSEDREQLNENIFYLVRIQEFFVKNISGVNIILKGVFFANKYYEFLDSVILEKDEVCKIGTTDNWSINLSKSETFLNLIASDILGNNYNIRCKIDYLPKDGFIKAEIEGKEYIGFEYVGIVNAIRLPEYQSG